MLEPFWTVLDYIKTKSEIRNRDIKNPYLKLKLQA